MAESETTSWNLVGSAAAGSATARAEFARRYGPLIRTQLEMRWSRQPLRQEIDEAIQEVFMECLKPNGVLARADRSVAAGFRRLLGAVVRNVALRTETRLARHHLRHRTGEEPVTDRAGSQTSIAHRMDREWARAVTLEAAEEQERRAASVGAKALLRVKLLRSHFEEGRSIPEIAALWGLTPAHLHHQYAKARQDYLRALLAVLAHRFPDAPKGEVEALARQLVELLRGS